VLYVSEEFGTAAHLCACGCGAKVRTPLGQAEWTLKETANGPTLRPSVGNWQHPCRSHYLITDGQIIWCGQWTPEEILAGRQEEEEYRAAYFEDRQAKRRTPMQKLWHWVKRLFKPQ